MTNKEYQSILLNAFLNHRKFLANQLKREMKEAFKNDIPNEEFIDRCNKVISGWQRILNNQVFERKNELGILIGLNSKKPKLLKQLKDEMNQLTPDNFYLNLGNITNGEIIGFLTSDEIQEVKERISELLQSKPERKEKPSYTAYAMALSMAGITLSVNGKGVNDGKDYTKIFGLDSARTLYNRLNKIEDIAKPEKIKPEAEQIIKKYKL